MECVYSYCVSIRKANFNDDLLKIVNIANYLRNNLNCRYSRDYRVSSDNEYHYYHFKNHEHSDALKQEYETVKYDTI